MSHVPRTASLFGERPEVSPPVAAPQVAPPPSVVPAPPAPPLRVPRSQELWAAVQLPAVAALDALASAAQRFTPRVSLEPPDALLLELHGSVALFGGLAALRERLAGAFPAATVALAPTPLAALAFARAGRSCCLTEPMRLVSRLAPLPLVCLRWPEEAIVRLGAMGVRSIGEALRLPRAGFAQRFGETLLDSLDRLVGRSADPRRAHAPVPRFRERCEPPYEPTDAAAILRVIGPLLEALEAFLCGRQRGVTALRLTLEHRAHPPTRCVLRLASPEHAAAAFARLLGTRLEALALPGPVRRCTLQSGPLLEYVAASAGLWRPGEQGGGAGAQMPAFLERLRARLGDAAVHGLALHPGHRPERLTRAVPPVLCAAAAERGRRARPAPSAAPPWASGTRPLWLLRAPRPLAPDNSGYPCDGGLRLTLLAGPERLETGWWDGGDILRDYYVAADAEGARLWIFRERNGPQRWFVHGHFG